MKKIMVMAAAVLMGVMAHAASAAWYAEDIYGYDTGALAQDCLLYFFDVNDVSVETARTSVAAGDFSFLGSGYLSDYQEDGEGMTEGGTYGNGVDVTGYFVVFNTGDTASATYAFVSDTETATTGAAGQSASFDIMGTASATPSNWVQIAPEPTSGMLLLVGGALLALRRKQK